MSLYLMNAWYVLAYGDEVTQTPLARTLMDVPIVLYRTESGVLNALEDMCPHRFAPLSVGKVVGEDIECGYHGLKFDCSGKCSFNPHGSGTIPKRATVRAFPVVERYGAIWIWPGDAEQWDETLIPDYGFLSDEKNFDVVKGRLHVKGNYMLVVDNLLDLSHAAYVHPDFAVEDIPADELLAATEVNVVKEAENKITAYRYRRNLPPNVPTQKLFGFGPEPVDARTHMTWTAPSLMTFDLGAHLVGEEEKEGLCLPAMHAITPETETTSHYFFAQARNMRRNDKAADEALYSLLYKAFHTEDEPMIEAVQRRMGPTGDLDSLKPVLLQSDGAPAYARRLLKKLIENENKEAVL